MAVRIAICQRVELSPVEQPEYGIAKPEIGVYKQHAQEAVMNQAERLSKRFSLEDSRSRHREDALRDLYYDPIEWFTR